MILLDVLNNLYVHCLEPFSGQVLFVFYFCVVLCFFVFVVLILILVLFLFFCSGGSTYDTTILKLRKIMDSDVIQPTYDNVPVPLKSLKESLLPGSELKSLSFVQSICDDMNLFCRESLNTKQLEELQTKPIETVIGKNDAKSKKKKEKKVFP